MPPHVPRLFEREPRPFRKSDLLGALPRLAHVGGALNGASVRERVGRRVEHAVALIDDRVEDVPALERRRVEPPGAAIVGVELEQPLPRADEDGDAHGETLTIPWSASEPISSTE
jgi:hypothetical protein